MRMSADTLDLSRFPAPLAIRGLDYEAVLGQRLARLKTLLAERGLDWDVDVLESDPAVVLQEADAYRELLHVAGVNDAVRAVMVAFAIGSDLDHLAAFYGVQRRTIAPATGNAPAIMESDAEFRRRVLLAPEAFAAAGPAGAYLYHCLSADPRVLNADIWSPAPGEVSVAVQSREGSGESSDDLVVKVRARLNRDDIKPLTDVVNVRSVTTHVYDVSIEAFVLPGPDPAAVQSAISERILAVAASRRTPSRDMARSAIIAAAQLDVVDKVILLEPATDVARGFGEVPVLGSLSISVNTYDG